MKILKWIKGKIKQNEMRKLEPDKDFEFKENYYGDININEGFKFIYCNNYTNRLYNEKNDLLSFISCVVTIPLSEKSLRDLVEFMNIFHNTENMVCDNYFTYNPMCIEMDNENEKIHIYLRGDINLYDNICSKIHNNIISKYIRNNIFPNETPIETPNQFLNNMYNSITNPCKDIDILFIEDKLFKGFDPVIGLSISKKCDKIDLEFYDHIELNNRYIVYIQIHLLEEEEFDYICFNVDHGNKLLELVHKGIEDDIDLDIDEIID